MRTPITIAAVAIAASLAACGGDAIDADTSFSTQKGAKLVDESGQLTITARMFDGVQPTTKHKRFTKVTVKRGEQSKSYWCSNHTGVSQELVRASSVSCNSYVETISNDDDESFSFTIVERWGGGESPTFELTNIYYMGDGTFLADEVKLLVGDVINDNMDWWDIEYALDDLTIPLTASARGKAKDDPFRMSMSLNYAVSDFIGQKVYFDDVEEHLKVRALSFGISNEMDIGIDAVLSKSGSIRMGTPSRVSVLTTPGVIASGYANDVTIVARVNAAFNGPVVPNDIDEAISNAISPLGGPVADLVGEVDFEQLDQALADALKAAGQTIENREFEGTDYSAEVFGYYMIFATPDASEPSAYVVYGGGAGEPDYHDGIVIGFDLDGNEVYYEEDSG